MGSKFEEFGWLLGCFVLYPTLASLVLRIKAPLKDVLFAYLNITTCFGIVWLTLVPRWRFNDHGARDFYLYGTALFVVYLATVAFNYTTLWLSERRQSWTVAAYLSPIAFLVAFKYVPTIAHVDHNGIFIVFLGISYMSFRLCHLVSEIKNKVVQMPTSSQYFAYAFFPPIQIVGPITPYSLFAESLNLLPLRAIRPLRALSRILTGIVKFIFLSAVLGQVGYGGAFMTDGHPHSTVDLAIAILIYPLFLYFNFSGMCDIAVGVSALMGIRVIENFNSPFLARNVQEFWTRWHISLSTWLRNMVFTPLVKLGTRSVGVAQINHVIAATIIIVFLVIGLWHGASWNFVLFGLSQGIGVGFNHYGNIFLRKHLSKDRYARYQSLKATYWLGVFFSYLYFAASCFLFANSIDQMKEIFSHIR